MGSRSIYIKKDLKVFQAQSFRRLNSRVFGEKTLWINLAVVSNWEGFAPNNSAVYVIQCSPPRWNETWFQVFLTGQVFAAIVLIFLGDGWVQNVTLFKGYSKWPDPPTNSVIFLGSWVESLGTHPRDRCKCCRKHGKLWSPRREWQIDSFPKLRGELPGWKKEVGLLWNGVIV